MTGHQHHFLSRLDRVSMPHVELALSLYRDHQLVRYLLQSVRLPDGAERAAISLEHPERGPFLVVTREGRFVTCLGEGMAPTGLPVITRGQLDGIAAKADDVRARLVECRKLSGERGGTGQLLRRIYDAGDELSREEFIAISALQPLYALEFLTFMFAVTEDLDEACAILVRELRNTDKLRALYRDTLRSYWNSLWAIGHFAVLTAMDGKVLLEQLSDKVRETVLGTPFSFAAVRQGVCSLALRGVWATARMGKPFLPVYKKLVATSASYLSVVDTAMSLAAIGLRHARLRAEVQKALRGQRQPLDPVRTAALERMWGVLHKMLDADFDHPEVCATLQRDIGARICVLGTRGLPPGAPLRFEREEDVPEDLAMSMAVCDGTAFLSEPAALKTMFASLPWLSRAAPESLYLPREVIRALHVPWEPEMTLRYLRAQRDYHRPKRKKRVAAAPAGPARKGPCPCGSGKKYKRCCEARQA